MMMFRSYSSIVVINFCGLYHIRFTRPHLRKTRIVASWQLDSLLLEPAYSVRHERQ